MTRLWGTALKTYLAVTLAFLYLPIAVMVLMAFNQSPLYKLPMVWDTVWFERLVDNDRLLTAAAHSIVLALANTAVATALGTMAAFAFARYQFRGKTLLQILLFPPITIPWLIIGTSMLVLFFWVGIGRGLHSLLLGHVALSIPYVVVVVGARLKTFGPVYEEAAATLGAAPWQRFWRISAPLMAPGVIAAALFAFAVSFDQFVISYFLAPPGWTTLPVEIYSSIRKGFTPEINAISSIIIFVSMGLMLVFARLYRFGGER
jgi:spermidine/putrescine transport system permease protein